MSAEELRKAAEVLRSLSDQANSEDVPWVTEIPDDSPHPASDWIEIRYVVGTAPDIEYPGVDHEGAPF